MCNAPPTIPPKENQATARQAQSDLDGDTTSSRNSTAEYTPPSTPGAENEPMEATQITASQTRTDTNSRYLREDLFRLYVFIVNGRCSTTNIVATE